MRKMSVYLIIIHKVLILSKNIFYAGSIFYSGSNYCIAKRSALYCRTSHSRERRSNMVRILVIEGRKKIFLIYMHFWNVIRWGSSFAFFKTAFLILMFFMF